MKMFIANIKIKKRIKIIKEVKNIRSFNKHAKDFGFINIVHCKSLKKLEAEYVESITAKNKLDDKAKSLLIGTTLFSTLLGAYVNMIHFISEFNICKIFEIIYIIVASISLFFIILSGIFAAIVITNENIIYTYNKFTRVDILAIKIAIICNRLCNLKRNNYLNALSCCLKFGFLFSFVSFLLFVIAA